jgi:hypothetical protein
MRVVREIVYFTQEKVAGEAHLIGTRPSARGGL